MLLSKCTSVISPRCCGRSGSTKIFLWGWHEVSWWIAVLSSHLTCTVLSIPSPGSCAPTRLRCVPCHATMLLTLQGLFWFSLAINARSDSHKAICLYVSWVRNCNLTYFLDAKIVKCNFWCSLTPVHFLWRILSLFFHIRSTQAAT